MALTEKSLQQEGARKLKKVREHLKFSPQEMASRLGVSRTTYWKNENGEAFPGYHSLKRLVTDYDISMDWFIFNRGPMFFKEKEKLPELEKQLEELKKEKEKVPELERQLEELKKELEAEKISIPPKEMDMKPEIKELVEHMERIPLLYHEVLVGFQKFKLEHKDLLGAGIGDKGD